MVSKLIGPSVLVLLFLFFMVQLSGCDLAKPTQGAFFNVNAEACIGCRNCEKVCNADAIIIISGKAVIDPTKCIECAKCVSICPVDAID